MNTHPSLLPLGLAAGLLLVLAGVAEATVPARPVRAQTASTGNPSVAAGPVATADAAIPGGSDRAPVARERATPAATPSAAAAPPAAPALLRYPDGSTRPCLNGVTEALEPSFTVAVPFAPIVGTERCDHGLDWYVHENGVRSTSFRDGRGLPFAAARRPAPAGPARQ